MLKKYFATIILTFLFLSGCGAKKEYYTEVKEYAFAEEFINFVPDHVNALLPKDMTKEEAYSLLPKEVVEFNFAKFGRYDGYKMGNYGTTFYPISEKRGFVFKLYGLNQSIIQSVAEVYFFDGVEYKLIHYIDDAIPGSYAITDTKRLYIPLNNGNLRSVAIDGTVKDYYDAFDINNGDIDMRLVHPHGEGNVIEFTYLNELIGDVAVE